jgi:hypothetical protein
VERRQDNALQFWKRLWIGDRTMLCKISKDYDKATRQCSAVLEKIKKYNGKATGQFSSILENIIILYYNDKATGQCFSVFEKIMTRRQDNALQYWKIQ